jgi:hypothetical protein
MEDVCVSGATLKEAAELLQANKKIQAIKVVRVDSSCSLKSAKQAVENYMDELGMVPSTSYGKKSWKNSEARLRPRCFIRAVDLAVGSGTVTVDLEEAKFRVSAAMGDVGLNEARRLLNFLELLDKFSKGEDISFGSTV